MKKNIEEIWKPILGYEGYYEISNLGRVKSLPRNYYNIPNKVVKERLLKILNQRDYRSVILRIDGKPKSKLLHRLIATAFIPNPYNLPYINHKNGNKMDNRIENLEWCSAKENTQHAFKIGIMKGTKQLGKDNGRARAVKRTDINGKVEVFDTIIKAGESINKKPYIIKHVLKTKNLYNNFKFEYA